LNRYLGLEAPESRTTNILAKPTRLTQILYDTETDRERSKKKIKLAEKTQKICNGISLDV
jgi:hypothetical protein